jgi:3',5'-cyclic AMP phosphodiesterase CpdA
MTIVLHVSDPHFGTEQPAVLEALVALAHSLTPDLLVLSGDITQRARARQFRAAADFVKRLRIPRALTIPGNHDVPLFNVLGRALDPYAGYRACFGSELEPRFSAPDCLVLAVKTTRRYRHVDGEVDRAQRERVAGQLTVAERTQLRLVVLHQPVAVPRASEEHNVCVGSEAAVRTWAAAGADLILAGHIHLPFLLPLHEVFAGLPRPMWALNAGTAVSSRIRHDAGNSVNVLRTRQAAPSRSCCIEEWRYSAPRSAFIQSSEVTLTFS